MLSVLGRLGLLFLIPIDIIGALMMFAYDSGYQVHEILGMEFTRTDTMIGMLCVWIPLTVIFALMAWSNR